MSYSTKAIAMEDHLLSSRNSSKTSKDSGEATSNCSCCCTHGAGNKEWGTQIPPSVALGLQQSANKDPSTTQSTNNPLVAQFANKTLFHDHFLCKSLSTGATTLKLGMGSKTKLQTAICSTKNPCHNRLNHSNC